MKPLGVGALLEEAYHLGQALKFHRLDLLPFLSFCILCEDENVNSHLSAHATIFSLPAALLPPKW